MQGLRLDKTGASSLLQFSLTTNTLLDPGFFLLWDALVHFRRYASPVTEAVTLELAAWQPDRLKKPGPCGVLASRLTEIGWVHVTEFVYLDQEGCQIDIVRCPIQELKCRAKRAWHQYVGACTAYRKGFQGLEYVDVATSTTPVTTWTPDEAGLIRALHNGTFITHDHLHSAKQVDSDKCKFCGAPGSLQHRHWECRHTEHLRQNLSQSLMSSVDSWPACTRERGWFVEPQEVRDFKRSLAEVLLSLLQQSTQSVEIFKVAWNPVDKQRVMDWIAAHAGNRQFHKVHRDLGEMPSAEYQPLATVATPQRGLHAFFVRNT
eukprot:s391_g19.t1